MGARLLALLALAACAQAWAESRPVVKMPHAMRIANYAAPSVLVKGEDARAIVRELNELRNRPWMRGDAKLACYSSVIFMDGPRTTVTYRFTPERLVERTLEKGQATNFNVEIGDGDLPTLTRHLAEIAPAKCEPPPAAGTN